MILIYTRFFLKTSIFKKYSDEKAKIITSIAMFYDLEDPAAFVKDIEAILSDTVFGILNKVICPPCFAQMHTIQSATNIWNSIPLK